MHGIGGHATHRKLWIWLFAALALAVMVGAAFFYYYERGLARSNGYTEIASVSQLKVDQIGRWRRERLSDAQIASHSFFLKGALQAWQAGSMSDPGLRAELEAWLKLQLGDGLYSDAYLLDPNGKALLWANTPPPGIPPKARDALLRASATGSAVLSDLFLDRIGDAFIDTIAPVMSASGSLLGLVDLRTDAHGYLFQLIESWPTPSPTAETLLVRAEPGGVLFLNDLRYRAKSALSLLFPIAANETPAVQAVTGRQGMFEGRDYRGVPVLADLRPIPDSPWFLVSKVDAAEIYAEANFRSAISLVIAVLLLLLAGAATAFGFRRRQARLYLELLRAERKERELEQEFRTTLYSIGDAVIGTDTNGTIWHMNPEAERLTGWTENDATGKHLDEVFHIIREETRQRAECPADRVVREGIVVGLANHTLLIGRDGTERPIADSGSPIRDEQGSMKGVVLVFRDQTEELNEPRT